MPERRLDLEVLRNGKPMDEFAAHGDPEDIAWLQLRLQGWLEGNGWDRGLWRSFEVIARDAGKSKQLAKVRAL
jgi:hypothetical protein